MPDVLALGSQRLNLQLKGLAAFELASALVSLGEKRDLGEARRLLEEAALILDYDPKDTNHGKLADVAKKQLESLN